MVFALLFGSAWHNHRGEALPRGTFLEHAPSAPVPERPCVACALAALSASAAVPYYLVPPLVHPIVEVCSECIASAPDTPELSGRSPPPFPA